MKTTFALCLALVLALCAGNATRAMAQDCNLLVVMVADELEGGDWSVELDNCTYGREIPSSRKTELVLAPSKGSLHGPECEITIGKRDGGGLAVYTVQQGYCSVKHGAIKLNRLGGEWELEYTIAPGGFPSKPGVIRFVKAK